MRRSADLVRGTDRNQTTSIDGLVDLIEEIAGVGFHRRSVVDDSPAVARHQLDHDAAEAAMGWEPSAGIAEEIMKTC
ncbi:MAG: hypothetical protein GY895_16985 [Phycisphaera sp.]|nr:hypothetical protein [Phycisphaera sp.]